MDSSLNIPNESGNHWDGAGGGIRQWAADAWINLLITATRASPRFTRAVRSFFLFFAWRCSRSIRRGTLSNARWLLGPQSTVQQRTKLAKSVVRRFYDFICEFGHSMHMSLDELKQFIGEVHGEEHFTAARASRNGLIMVTAHLGSFERGVAGLLAIERIIHVLYHPDQLSRFEEMRSEHRQRVGVIEAPVTEGVATWMKLRDVLQNDGAVLIPADRMMPGQVGLKVPFCGGHIRIPAGPLKLAMTTGSPVVPVFSICRPDGKVDIYIEPALRMPEPPQRVTADHPAVLELAGTLERYITRYPQQWMMLHPVWCEDTEASDQ